MEKIQDRLHGLYLLYLEAVKTGDAVQIERAAHDVAALQLQSGVQIEEGPAALRVSF